MEAEVKKKSLGTQQDNWLSFNIGHNQDIESPGNYLPLY